MKLAHNTSTYTSNNALVAHNIKDVRAPYTVLFSHMQQKTRWRGTDEESHTEQDCCMTLTMVLIDDTHNRVSKQLDVPLCARKWKDTDRNTWRWSKRETRCSTMRYNFAFPLLMFLSHQFTVIFPPFYALHWCLLYSLRERLSLVLLVIWLS